MRLERISVTMQGHTAPGNLIFSYKMVFSLCNAAIRCFFCHLANLVHFCLHFAFRLRPFYLQFMHWPVFIKISLPLSLFLILLTLQPLINLRVHLCGLNAKHLFLPFKGTKNIKWKLFSAVKWFYINVLKRHVNLYYF